MQDIHSCTPLVVICTSDISDQILPGRGRRNAKKYNLQVRSIIFGPVSSESVDLLAALVPVTSLATLQTVLIGFVHKPILMNFLPLNQDLMRPLIASNKLRFACQETTSHAGVMADRAWVEVDSESLEQTGEHLFVSLRRPYHSDGIRQDM